MYYIAICDDNAEFLETMESTVYKGLHRVGI